MHNFAANALSVHPLRSCPGNMTLTASHGHYFPNAQGSRTNGTVTYYPFGSCFVNHIK